MMLNRIILVLACATSAQATVLSGAVTEKQELNSTRQSPFFAVNYGGTIVPLGQELHPSFSDCSFFYLGNLIYIFRGDTLMGAFSDQDYRFRSAENMLVNQVLPRPDGDFQASPKEVTQILALADKAIADGNKQLW
jgi:hypothetical protein